MARLFRFLLFFSGKRKFIFGYFYFTTEKVTFIYGRPLVRYLIHLLTGAVTYRPAQASLFAPVLNVLKSVHTIIIGTTA